MILMREITPGAMRRAIVAAGASTPSIAEQDLHVAGLGIAVDVRRALLDRLGDDRVHELDDRRVGVGRLAERDLELGLRLVLDVRDRVVEPASRPISAAMSSGAAAAGRTFMPVIIDISSSVRTLVGSAIARITAPSGEEADRHRLVALGDLERDQVDRAHVDVEHRQVDVVEAEALGQRAGELVVADHPGLDQHLAGRPALLARVVDRLLDVLAARKSHVDDDVADQPLRTPAPTGRDQAPRVIRRDLLGGRRRRPGGIGAHKRAIGPDRANFTRVMTDQATILLAGHGRRNR